MKNRIIGNENALLFGIARFYEDLTAHVVGGARLGKEFEIDLEHPEWDSMVEVKASGSRQWPLIYVGQLERHLKDRGFPYKHCCYAIWTYYNTRQSRIGTAKVGTVRQLYAELARRTRMLTILDASILEAALSKRGTTAVWRDGDYQASRLRINTTWLRSFAAAPLDTLQSLRLKPRSFCVQQARTRTVFENQSVNFEYTAVLPKSAAGYQWPIHTRARLSALHTASAAPAA